MNEIKEKDNDIIPEKLVCVKTDGTIFNFDFFKCSFNFASSIYDSKITLEKTKKDKYKMLKELQNLKNYDPNNLVKINSKKETLINVEKFYNNRDVIETFENEVFPFKDGFRKEESDASEKTSLHWVM